VDCARHPHPEPVRPVRVRTGAFGERQPHRDLFLPRDQRRVDRAGAGGAGGRLPPCRAACESYLDPGDVANFARGDGPVVPYPDFASRAWEAHGCGPLVVAGAELTAMWQRLVVRAAAEALAA